jgi:hypothetical protein
MSGALSDEKSGLSFTMYNSVLLNATDSRYIASGRNFIENTCFLLFGEACYHSVA